VAQEEGEKQGGKKKKKEKRMRNLAGEVASEARHGYSYFDEAREIASPKPNRLNGCEPS
jgi:phage gp16-like protein